jgi:hypothetical protein
MLRILGWLLVVWGVAVWATWGSYYAMGIAGPEKLVSSGIGGGILIAIGYWLKRATNKQSTEPANAASNNSDKSTHS